MITKFGIWTKELRRLCTSGTEVKISELAAILECQRNNVNSRAARLGFKLRNTRKHSRVGRGRPARFFKVVTDEG